MSEKSDDRDFPAFPNDEESSEESEDSENEENSENSESEENLSAEKLIDALRNAEVKTSKFKDLSEDDRLENDFITKSFEKVTTLYF